MEAEIKSMKNNNIWDLVELLKKVKPMTRKWIFKIKKIEKVMLKDIKHVSLPKV